MYTIKEIYYTIQGEGFHTGRPAVFVRFTGCNLWTGHENDRANAICNFCDTDFIGTDGPGGGKFETSKDLADTVLSKWPTKSTENRFVVFTGGEPLLQLDKNLIEALHSNEFEIAVETNGTIKAPKNNAEITLTPPALQASCTGGTETKTVASPPMAKKPITPKFINPANPHCILTPIAITAEIKQRFNIDRAMPQD